MANREAGHNRENRRSRRAEVNNVEPLEEQEIQVEREDGTIIIRNLTVAERYLRAHLDRIADGPAPGTLEQDVSRSRERERMRYLHTLLSQEETDPVSRVKMVAHVFLFLVVSFIIVAAALSDAGPPDDQIQSEPQALRSNPVAAGGKWYESPLPTSVYFRGILLESPMSSVGGGGNSINVVIESKGSSILDIRLASLNLTIDPPLEIPYFGEDANDLPEVPPNSNIPQFDARGRRIDPHIAISSLEFQGLHRLKDETLIMNGRGSRGGISMPVKMHDYTLLNHDERVNEVYNLYTLMAKKSSLERANYFQNIYNLSNPGGRVATPPNSMGFKLCDLYVTASTGTRWSDSVVSNSSLSQASGRGFPIPEKEGHIPYNAKPIEKKLAKNKRLQRISAMSPQARRWLADDETPDDLDGAETLLMRILSKNCPSLSMDIRARALNLSDASYLLLVLFVGFMVLVLFEAVAILRFINRLEHDEAGNKKSKVNISSLVLHILVSGFESGMLFNYGMDSALYVPGFVITAVFRTLVSIILLIKVTVLCWRLQMTRRVEALRNAGALTTNVQLSEACRREAHSFVRLLTAASAGGLIVLQRVFTFFPEVFVVLYSVLWFPQLLMDYRKGHHRSLPKSFILALSSARLYMPFVIWSLPAMPLPLEKPKFIRTPFDGMLLPDICRAPNPFIGFIVTFGILLPALVLIVGHTLGPRWWVPMKCLPQIYDYRTRPIIDVELIKHVYVTEGRAANDTDVMIGQGKHSKDIIYKAAYGWKELLMYPWYRFRALGDAESPTKDSIEEILDATELSDFPEIPVISVDKELDVKEGDPGPRYEIECVICMGMVTVPLEDIRDTRQPQKKMKHALSQLLPLAIYLYFTRDTTQESAPAREGADNDEQRIWALAPCEHLFHEDCLKEWLEVKMECPTCRRTIPQFVD